VNKHSTGLRKRTINVDSYDEAEEGSDTVRETHSPNRRN
jgi:hypothetical protein